jgi:hypothetical protein
LFPHKHTASPEYPWRLREFAPNVTRPLEPTPPIRNFSNKVSERGNILWFERKHHLQNRFMARDNLDWSIGSRVKH